jgi:ribosomal protein RSM22 (predicted rRNA methylase)
MSYSIGELDSIKQSNLLERCLRSSVQLLIVIEPGTPVGFERIRRIRSELIQRGGFLVAPCPHDSTCPIEKGDWCHFTVRVERSSLHRRLKEGSLGYEDEKFSYVAFAKEKVAFPQSRVLRHPERHSGHIKLKLCTSNNSLDYPIISKKMGELYKHARKTEWGETFPPFGVFA